VADVAEVILMVAHNLAEAAVAEVVTKAAAVAAQAV
jgi:hypothetical protein